MAKDIQQEISEASKYFCEPVSASTPVTETSQRHAPGHHNSVVQPAKLLGLWRGFNTCHLVLPPNSELWGWKWGRSHSLEGAKKQLTRYGGEKSITTSAVALQGQILSELEGFRNTLQKWLCYSTFISVCVCLFSYGFVWELGKPYLFPPCSKNYSTTEDPLWIWAQLCQPPRCFYSLSYTK